MKHITFLIGVIFLFLSSCTKEERCVVSTLVDETLFCSLDTYENTKTSIDHNGNVLWNSGDQIVAFKTNTLPLKYQIQERYVGRTTGGFSKVAEGGNDDDLFTSQDIDHNILVYPYSTDVWCEKADNQSPTESYRIDLVLPAVQQYQENTFANGSFPMVAVSATNQFAFKNICGGIKLQLKGESKIKTIKIKGGNNELLSGGAFVTCYANGSTPKLTMYNSASKEIVLECGKGVQLNKDVSTIFIISLPPVVFSNGFTVTLENIAGEEEIITTSKSNSVFRSSLLVMPEITSKLRGEQQANEIWYSSSDNAIIEPKSTAIFGASITSNSYIDGKGVITFNKDITSVGIGAFRDCLNLTEISIPNGVIKIDEGAFSGCLNLSKISIPKSVISIGAGAFRNCKKLLTLNITDLSAWCNIQCVDINDEEAVIISHPFSDSENSLNTKLLINGKDIADVTIPEDVSKISAYAFYRCSNIKKVNVPNSVTSIETGAFAHSGLESFTFPSSVAYVGDLVLDNCPITEIECNVSSSASFGSLGELSALSVLKGTCAYDNSLIVANKIIVFACKSGVKTCIISDDIEEIANYAFAKCQLDNVSLNSKVLVRYGAFYGAKIEQLNIPNGVKVENGSFAGCSAEDVFINSQSIPHGSSDDTIGPYEYSSFRKITFGPKVEYIGLYAFGSRYSGNGMIDKIYFQSSTPPKGSCIINYGDVGYIYVPTYYLAIYQNDDIWGSYAGRMISY